MEGECLLLDVYLVNDFFSVRRDNKKRRQEQEHTDTKLKNKL